MNQSLHVLQSLIKCEYIKLILIGEGDVALSCILNKFWKVIWKSVLSFRNVKYLRLRILRKRNPKYGGNMHECDNYSIFYNGLKCLSKIEKEHL